MPILEHLGYTKGDGFFLNCEKCGTFVAYQVIYNETNRVNNSASIAPVDHHCPGGI